MKKLLFTLFALGALFSTSVAQSFEGKIVYGIELKGEGADQFAAFMPSSYEYTVKESNLKFKMNGGMTSAMMGEFIVLGDREESYMVKHSEKTAYKMEPDEDEKESDIKPTVTKEKETAKIQGYTCQKYKVVMNSDGNEVVQYMWVTNEIKFKKPKNAQNAGQLFVDGIDGFPLKVTSEMNTMGMAMTMIMTATSVDTRKVSDSVFEIPNDYEIKKFDPAMFGRMGK